MKVIIRLTEDAETKALPILLRHSPGMVLPQRTYVLSEDAIGARRFLTTLKRQLKQEFQQEEILIIEREVGLL